MVFFLDIAVRDAYFRYQDQHDARQKYEKHCAYFRNPEVKKQLEKATKRYQTKAFIQTFFGDLWGYPISEEANIKNGIVMKYYEMLPFTKYKLPTVDAVIRNEGKIKAFIFFQSASQSDFHDLETKSRHYCASYENVSNVRLLCNFHKLRIYVSWWGEYHEMDLFDMHEGKFKALYLLVHPYNVLRGYPNLLYEESFMEYRNMRNQKAAKRLQKELNYLNKIVLLKN